MARLEEIRAVIAVLTSRCNLACGYCFQNAKSRGRMSWDTLRAALDLLLASRRTRTSALFYGGEPLLEFALIRRAIGYLEAHRRPKRRLDLALVTNGTLLGRDAAEFLIEHDVGVQLSFDGTATAQRLRGAGTFSILDALLDRLQGEHPGWFERRLTVSMTLVPETVPHLAQSVRYFLGKGVREIALSPAVTDSSCWSADRPGELDDQFREVFEVCRDHYLATGRVPLSAFRRSETEPRRAASRSLCGAGRGEALTVDVDAQVYGCVMFAESYQTFASEFLGQRMRSMRLGDVRDARLPERLAAYPARARAAEIFDHLELKHSCFGRCAECEWFATCSFCPIAIGHQPGNTDPHRVPDFLCAYNRVLHEYRRRFPAQRHPLAGYSSLPVEMSAIERLRTLVSRPILAD